MRKLKKIIFIAILTIVILYSISNKIYATIGCKTSLEMPREEYKAREEIECYIKISSLDTSKGIVAIGGKIEYDKNLLSLESIKGEDEWSNPSYNEENGKLISFRNGFAKQDENVFKIIFKVKDNAKGNIKINLKEFEVSDGSEEVTIENVSKTIKINGKLNNTENVSNSENKDIKEDVVDIFSKEENIEQNGGDIAQDETENNSFIWYIIGAVRNIFLNNCIFSKN